MSFLQKEVLFLQSRKDKWSLIIFMTLFVPFFLLVFQPFGVNNFDPNHAIDSVFFFSMLGFGLVLGLSLALFEFVLTPLFFKKQTLLRFVLKWISELVFIAFTVFMYYNVLGNFHDWHLASFLDFVFNITMMSIIPFAIIFLYYNNKQTIKAYELLDFEQMPSTDEMYITLYSYNKKEGVTIMLKNFIYGEAQDNYVAIYYMENEKLRKQLLRNKLSDLEIDLKTYGIVRCHRSYIVNINSIEKISQTGKKMKILLKAISQSIPVSNTYYDDIRSNFPIHHK